MLITPGTKYSDQDGRDVRQIRLSGLGTSNPKSAKAVNARLAELEARLEQMIASCTDEQVKAVRSAIDLLDEVKEQSKILDQWQVTLFDGMSDCVVVIENDNLISYINPAFCKLFGYRSDEILGKPYVAFVRNWTKIGEEARAGRKRANLLRAEIRHKNGHFWTVRIKVHHYLGPNGDRIRSVMQIVQEGERRRHASSNYDILINDSSDPIALVDTEKKTLIHANPAFLSLFNYKLSEAKSLTLYDLISGNHEQIDAHFFYVLKGKKLDLGEYEKRDAAGNLKTFSVSASMISYRGKDVLCITLRATSIKHEQSAVAETWIETFFENAGVGMMLFDGNGKLLATNAAFKKVLGYGEDELHQQLYTDLIYPDDYQSQKAIIQDILSGKTKSSRFEKRYLCKDGQVVWVKMTICSIRERGSKVYGIAIVENNEVNKQIQDQLRLLELAVEHTKDAVIISSASEPGGREPKVLYANKAFEELTGYMIDEIVGKSPEVLHRITPPAPAPQNIREAIIRKTAVHTEVLNYKKDGTQFWAWLSITPILNKDGLIENWVAIMRDITERKQTEEKLRQNTELLGAVFEQSADVLLVVDKNTGIILDCNQSAVLLFDVRDKQALIGTPGLSLQKVSPTPDEAAKIYEQLERFGVWSKEFEFTSSKGNVLWMNLAIKQVSVGGEQLYLVRLHDVTDRRTAENAVRENEEKYRTLVANIPGAVYRCKNDEEWTMDFISDSIKAISGYEKDEFVNNAVRSFVSIVHPEDVESIRRFIEISLEARQPYELEYRIIHKDGTFRWVYEKGQAIFDQQWNVQWLEGVIIDATELKRAEEAKIAVQIVEEHANEMKIINEVLEKEIWEHRQTEVALYKRNTMLRAMADAARMLLTPEDLNSAITQVLNLLGNATEVDRVYIVENHQHPETGDLLMSMRYEWARPGRDVYSQASSFQNLPYNSGFSRWYDLLSQGMGVSGLIDEFPLSERWILEDRGVVSILIAPIMIGNAFWGFIGFDDCYTQHNWGGAEDVILSVAAGTIGEAVARKRMVQALSESEKKYRSVLDSITEVIFQTDTNRIVTFLNPAWAKITGYGLYESLGKDILGYIYPEDRDLFLSEFARIITGRKESVRIELRFLAKDGHTGWIEMFVQGVMGEEGRPIGLSGTLSDISNRKEAEQQANNLTQQLLQAQKMEAIGTLAGGIAHDFNNIMGIITMAIAHMRIKAKMDEILLKDAEIVDEAAGRGAGIAKQLLTFSRSQKTQVMPISVSHVVKQLKRMLSHSLPKDIEIQTEFRDSCDMINGDHGQIYQVLLNLAVNSGDAMPNGGVLRFDVFSEQGSVLEKKFGKKFPEKMVAVRISDTGDGIPEDVQQRIFEPFFTTKEVGKGTGLGLSIVHGIVKSHDGIIDLQSALGKGTAFTLYFPLIEGVKKEDEAQTTVPILEGKETILIVDDENRLREVLGRTLSSFGYTVIEAINGIEGLEAYRQNRDQIGLILCDMGMPKMGGEEFFEKVKEINPEVKLIIMTGYLDPTKRERLLEKGVKDFVNKPFVLSQFMQVVRDVLELK